MLYEILTMCLLHNSESTQYNLQMKNSFRANKDLSTKNPQPIYLTFQAQIKKLLDYR